MSQFDEAMRRYEAESRQADADNDQAAAQKLRAAEQAATVVRKSLVDMARHLAERGARRYTHVWKNSPKRFASKSASPEGFVLDARLRFYGSASRKTIDDMSHADACHLELLTLDGNVWKYWDSDSSYPRFTKAGYLDITGEAIIEAQVAVGSGRVELAPDGELRVNYGYGDIKPYFEHLAELSQAMLSPNRHAWLYR